MRYDFTQEEVRVLKILMDWAVKGGGMQVAEAAVVLSKKLDDPLDAPIKEK